MPNLKNICNTFLILATSFSLLGLVFTQLHFQIDTQTQRLPGPDIICGEEGCKIGEGDLDGDNPEVAILNIIIGFGGILTYIGVGFAVVALVIAGLLYIFNREQEGRTLLKLVFYGLIIIIFAYTAVSLLVAFFNAL
jgi:hypothetical protein